jgi:hypothetical protein
MKRKITIGISLLFLMGSLLVSSCSKLLDTQPTNVVSDQIIYNNVSMLDAVLQATYSRLKNDVPGWFSNMAVNVKLLGTAYGSDINTDQNPIYGMMVPFKNASFYDPESYSPTEYASRGLWRTWYADIYNTNIILENVDVVDGEQAKKDEIKGQALVIRARCYYNLIRFYQHTYIIARDKPGVPLVLSSAINEAIPRATVEEVYASILKDLKEAEALLVNYTRPNLAYFDLDVVNFLLADVYLTMNNWSDARDYAQKIRTKYPLMSMAEYLDGFTTPNREWVLGYSQTDQDNTEENLATFWDYGQGGSPNPYRLLTPSTHFMDIMKDDPRGIFVPHPTEEGKFASVKFLEKHSSAPYGDLIDMRAAEMYLVEAEANARLGNTSEALNILHMIQEARPGAAVTTTTNQEELIQAILLERRKEMYGEGLDYFDIKRLQLPVEKSISNGNLLDLSLPANSNRLTLMIPDQEMLNNPAMVQNPDPSVFPVFIR